MFVLDMHNYVRQGVQNMNSNAFRGFEPEQIDILLNRAMMTKFNELYLPDNRGVSFEANTKRLSELSPLVVENYPVDVIVACTASGEPERVYNNDASVPTKYRVNLPDDFAIFNECQITVYYNDCNAISFSIEDISASYAPILFDNNPDNLGSTNFTGVTLDTPTGSIVIDSGVGRPQWSDYEFPQDGEVFLAHLIEAANKKLIDTGDPYKLYYESFNGFYKSGHILAVSTNVYSAPDEFLIKLTGMSDILKSEFTPISYKKIYDGADTTKLPANGYRKYSDYNFRKHYGLNRLLLNAFHRSNSDKVIITGHEKSIDLYTDETFFIDKVLLSYIRRPKPISLSLGHGCELNPVLHEKICDLAITYKKGSEQNPGYREMAIESVRGE